ncbi:hypothetical protein, partial [Arthrobacter woluwensis]|uniref:hypothetical protein n=1 Tax=Arthrobacter woluwensis TaxID=156980 RepID=UPI001C316FF3
QFLKPRSYHHSTCEGRYETRSRWTLTTAFRLGILLRCRKRLVDLAKEIEALEAKEAQEDEEERSRAEAGVKAGGNRWEGPTAI